VTATGRNDELLRLRGPATRVIDGRGRTVIPGLNDSHMHPIRGGLNYNLELRWDGVPSLADALRMLEPQPQPPCPLSIHMHTLIIWPHRTPRPPIPRFGGACFRRT
jgi:predicted amidohydrolase